MPLLPRLLGPEEEGARESREEGALSRRAAFQVQQGRMRVGKCGSTLFIILFFSVYRMFQMFSWLQVPERVAVEAGEASGHTRAGGHPAVSAARLHVRHSHEEPPGHPPAAARQAISLPDVREAFSFQQRSEESPGRCHCPIAQPISLVCL